VWAVVRSQTGDEYAPVPDTTDATGAFDLGALPPDLGTFTAHVSARAILEPGRVRRFWRDRRPEVREAEVILTRGQTTWALPSTQFAIVVLVFVASIAAGLVSPPSGWKWRAAKY